MTDFQSRNSLISAAHRRVSLGFCHNVLGDSWGLNDGDVIAVLLGFLGSSVISKVGLEIIG